MQIFQNTYCEVVLSFVLDGVADLSQVQLAGVDSVPVALCV
jgi:hypothetical protein